MNSGKKLADAFLESSRQLRLQPTNVRWLLLQRRLDERRRRRRKLRIFWISIGATVLVLLAVVIAFYLVLPRHGQPKPPKIEIGN